MGWLFYTDRRVKTYADEKAEITRLCTFETDTRKTLLLKACKVGSTWYAAAKVTNIDGSRVEDATYVTDEDGFAGAIKFGGFGIAVGERPSERARYALDSVAAVHHWLEI